MKLNIFIRSLSIFQKYYHDPEGYHFSTDRDIIYMYPTDKPISEEDQNFLKEWGWFQEDVMESDPYNPEEGWMAYL